MNEHIEAALRQSALAAMTKTRTKEIARLVPWQNCPKCHQSATGRYAGKLACKRDGWVEGQDDGGFLS